VNPLPPNSISACLAVRNEERTIERCLASLSGVVDEIVVVHGGPCSDRTLEIAERYGCRVFTGEHHGHGEWNTPLAYEQARGEWLLNLDADEFLSDELRSRLRDLVREPGVDGYSFRWPLWNGRRYITQGGPYKLVLMRRSATRMIGLSHLREKVEGAVRESSLLLEHRPDYNNFSPATIATKWRRWARIQAREYLSEPSEAPSFNCPAGVRWTRRRRLANRLSPLLIVPAGLHTFLYVLRAERKHLRPREALWFALSQGLYRSMVTAYVAKLAYLSGDRDRL
jgi:glycosyltransferase involved in cell wall biosynthesis